MKGMDVGQAPEARQCRGGAWPRVSPKLDNRLGRIARRRQPPAEGQRPHATARPGRRTGRACVARHASSAAIQERRRSMTASAQPQIVPATFHEYVSSKALYTFLHVPPVARVTSPITYRAAAFYSREHRPWGMDRSATASTRMPRVDASHRFVRGRGSRATMRRLAAYAGFLWYGNLMMSSSVVSITPLCSRGGGQAVQSSRLAWWRPLTMGFISEASKVQSISGYISPLRTL